MTLLLLLFIQYSGSPTKWNRVRKKIGSLRFRKEERKQKMPYVKIDEIVLLENLAGCINNVFKKFNKFSEFWSIF